MSDMPVQAPTDDPTNVRGKRIGAAFIDFAVLIIPSILLASAIFQKQVGATGCDQVVADLKVCVELGDSVYAITGGRVGAWLLLSALLGIAYYVVLQGKTGWTVGKRAVGIRVVDRDGSICGLGKAFVRYLPLLIPSLIPGLGQLLGALVVLTEFILILAHRRHQRIGDLWAKTYVVRQDAVGQTVPV